MQNDVALRGKIMKLNVRELTVCALFSALIAVGAFLKIDIPLPVYTMHFTLQWFFVIVASLILGAKLGATCVLVYLFIGLAGVPVFAAGGGIAYIFRPGFGFLLGFLLAAYVMGNIVDKIRPSKIWSYIAISSIGLILYYTVGAIYFYFIKNIYVGAEISFITVVVDYCLITVIPDFCLCVGASYFTVELKHRLKSIIYVESK